jgi:DNA-directed RNA polymerase subunit L
VFKDEDDTLGNLIQAFIHNTYYRTERLIEHRFRVSFVGYFCPHPLETKMHVRLTLRPPTEERTDITEDSITELAVRDFFKHALDELGAHLTDVHREWCHFTGRPMPEEAPETPPMEQPEPTTENAAETIPFGKVKSDAGPSAPPAKEPAAPPAKEKEPSGQVAAAPLAKEPPAKEKEPAAKEPPAKEKEKPKKKPVAKKKAVVEEATKVVEIEPSAKEPAGQVAAAKEKKKAAPKKKKVVEKEEE